VAFIRLDKSHAEILKAQLEGQLNSQVKEDERDIEIPKLFESICGVQ
jgi:hypothetical protein